MPTQTKILVDFCGEETNSRKGNKGGVCRVDGNEKDGTSTFLYKDLMQSPNDRSSFCRARWRQRDRSSALT